MANNTNITFIDYSTIVPATWLNNINNNAVSIQNVFTYGALGNNVHDDTLAIQLAVNALPTAGGIVVLPTGTFKISSPIIINQPGVTFVGAGINATNLVTTANMTAMLQFNSNASYCTTSGLSITQTGTTTPCVVVNQNAVVIRFSQCYFAGNLSGDLVYSNGQNIDFDRCTWQLSASGTWGINFDCFNQNCGITDCRFGGTGNGLRITNVFSPLNNVQGLKINHTYFENTGAYNIWLGNSDFTTITGCVLDQSNTHAVHLDVSANLVTITGNYFGASNLTNIGVWISPQAEIINIQGNTFGFGDYGVVANATVFNRITGLTITGNIFGLPGTTGNAILLDSVQSCTVTGNVDISNTGTNGSWNTKATFGPGQYNFANNVWFTATPALYDTNSHYNFVNEVGIVGHKGGVTSSGGATSSFTISHGCFTSPSRIIVSPYGGAGDFWITSITSTQFTVNWSSGAAVTDWFWEADCSH